MTNKTLNERTQIQLAELAISRPEASQVLHRHGLDYCCHGNRPLDHACQQRGLDPEAVLAEIDAAVEAAVEQAASAGMNSATGTHVRWDERPLDELIDYILETYHEPLRLELPMLVDLAKKVEARHAAKEACPHGLVDHLTAIHESVLVHLAKEEQALFPLIRSGRGALAGGPVQVMEDEHHEHAANLQRTRELTQDLTPPEDACPTWRALYLRLEKLEAELMEHIHLENNVLFPRALCEG